MNRLTPLFGTALLWLAGPAHAKDKPKPLAISACYGKMCITNLRWGRPSSFDGTYSPYLEGTLVNGSAATLRSPSLTFGLKAGSAGEDFIGTAIATYSGTLPTGARWVFRAEFPRVISGRYVGRTQSVILSSSLARNGGAEWLYRTLAFTPFFHPDDSGSIKRCEKIHGKRERQRSA